MSEQSLQTIDHAVPKFSEVEATDLDRADWGREVTQPAETTTETTDVSRETSAERTESEVDEVAEAAKERGWVPKEQWKGPEERWVDAKAFNDRYESVMPVVQRENKKLAAQLREAQDRIAELSKTAEQWQASQEEQQKAQRSLRLDALKMERKSAIENQDYDTLIRVDDELLELKVAERTAPAKPHQTQQVNPEVKRILLDFAAENPVFDKDNDMAQALAEQVTLMRASQSPLKGRDLLDKAKERVERMYPERFRGVPRRQHAMAETGGTPSGGRSGMVKTWNDLKPEYREANDRFIKTTPGITREDIIKNAPAEAFRS